MDNSPTLEQIDAEIRRRQRSANTQSEMLRAIDAEIERRRTSDQQRQQVAQQAGERHLNRAMTPMGLGAITQPFVNTITDPERRAQVGESFQGFVRDVQQLPNLDYGRLARETGAAVAQGVRDLPQTAGRIVQNLPQIARAATYGPFEDEERAQQGLDLARAQGDRPAMATRAREANAATASAGLNVAGPLALGGAQSVGRAALIGGAVDAPFALARNSDQPLQERLPSALTEVGGVAAFSAGLQGLANGAGALATRGERATGQIRQRAEQFERAGVRPFLAATSQRGGRTTMQVAENPIGGNARANLHNSLADVETARARLSHRYGEPVPTELAGEAIQAGVRRFSNGAGRGISTPQPRGGDPASIRVADWSIRDKAEALYDRVFDDLAFDERAMIAGNVEGQILSLDRTTAVLNEITSGVSGPRSAGRLVSPAIRDIQERITGDMAEGTLRFQDLRKWRTMVREAQRDEGLRQGAANSELQRLESALSEDIYRSADHIGGQAAQDLRKVDRWYRTVQGRVERSLQQFSDANGGVPAFARLRQLASTRGNSRQLLELRASLQPGEWRTVASAFINDMGRGADGKFSLRRFVHEYQGRNGLSEEGRRALFGGRELGTLYADLDNLVQVASYMDNVKGFTNWSQSGQSLQHFWTTSAAASAAAAAAAGNFIPALGVALFAITTRLSGEVLTNPAVVRWLTGAPKAGQSAAAARAHLARLVQLSARDPALAPVVAELSQHGLVSNDNQAGTPPQRAQSSR